jgi:deazaflavin-dependent oxidoreductase (nitroreductase family)
MMDDKIAQALRRDRTIDITTMGRKTGRPHRIEIWVHNIDGHLYISGLPGRRDWYANLLANPEFTFHLKQSVHADLPALARPVLDPAERREIIGRIVEGLDGERDIDAWVQSSPLVEVSLNLDKPSS